MAVIEEEPSDDKDLKSRPSSAVAPEAAGYNSDGYETASDSELNDIVTESGNHSNSSESGVSDRGNVGGVKRGDDDARREVKEEECQKTETFDAEAIEMSLTDSPGHSSSNDDFAAFLESELGDEDAGDEDDGDYFVDNERVKRRRVESPENNTCPHPGVYAGMCMRCGKKIDNESGVAFGYIHKNLRLSNEEIVRLREKDLKRLLLRKKLYLVLDLDHTLLNSSRLSDLTVEEQSLNLQSNDLSGSFKSSIFRIERMQMMTKLRPFVHTFLREASSMFEMWIYTMGERPYAIEMAKLLDPKDIYFNSKIIAQGDCTQRHQKGLDVVLGQENATLILDDTELVWGKHKDSLILMERYHFFASNCKHFGVNFKSLSEQRSDESESEGALSTVLATLEQIHTIFFDPGRKDELEARDVRQVLKMVRKKVLKGCKVVFSRVFPSNIPAESHHLWKMAEQLGATCTTELDSSVTHVVAKDPGTDKSRWALRESKHLVHPGWIEASNYMWKKQPEENFRGLLGELLSA